MLFLQTNLPLPIRLTYWSPAAIRILDICEFADCMNELHRKGANYLDGKKLIKSQQTKQCRKNMAKTKGRNLQRSKTESGV